MRYENFKSVIQAELLRTPAGLTWNELKARLNLPYDRPCPTWVARLEREIGLKRVRDSGRALVWTVPAARG